jgi:hypothetical protein
MYSKEDFQPINRNYVFFGGCLTVFFTIFIISIAIRAIPKPEPTTTSTQPYSQVIEKENEPVKDLSRYNVDSDNDRIPNFLEEELGMNPYESEESICDKENPICKSSPYDNKFKVSFLIDASSSMNILATNSSKLETIKDELSKLINTDYIDKRNYSFSIYSYGNQGSTGFIPDSESCVSVLRHVSNFSHTSRTSTLPVNSLVNLVPNGKSPIAFALKEVTRVLDPKDYNIIFIIADGVDDCGGDLDQEIKNSLSSGNVKRINAVSFYANEEANIYFKNVIEKYKGFFTKNTNFTKDFIIQLENDLYANWCHLKDYQKLEACVESKIEKPIASLNQVKNLPTTSSEEIVRINFVISGINLVSDNFLRAKKDNMNSRFQEFLKKPTIN